jgi:hypothetical protein
MASGLTPDLVTVVLNWWSWRENNVSLKPVARTRNDFFPKKNVYLFCLG